MKTSARVAKQNAGTTARSVTPPGLAAWQSGNLAKAEAYWRATLLRNPEDPLAPRALSDIVHQSGRYAEAAQLLRSFAASPPEYSNLGIALEKLGRPDE